MEAPTESSPGTGYYDQRSSNNSYRQRSTSQLSRQGQRPAQEQSMDSEKEVVSSEAESGANNAPMVVDIESLSLEPGRSMDSEKQVVSNEVESGASNAPMVVEKETSSSEKPQPENEAGKEVVSSWQTQSKGESAPISMDYHESQPPQGELLNDVKGPPPAYDDMNTRSRTESDDGLTTPSSIEPDSAANSIVPRPEDRTAVGQLLSWVPLAPKLSTQNMPRLVQPVIIPQLDVPPQGESVPFARCYSDALASHDISMRDFVAFLDGLALAQAPNSALQSLKMFGAGVSFIPLPIIPLAGKGISALASSGSGYSGGRARLYLERAKKEYFAPRGLHLSVVKDNDLNARFQIPTHAPRLAPLTKNTLMETTCRRRLEGLAPYVSPLRFDVPEEDKQIQGVNKLARKHQNHLFDKHAKRLKKLREDQWQDVRYADVKMRGWEEQYAAKMAELLRVQDDIVREQMPNRSDKKPADGLSEKIEVLRKLQRQVQLMESERHMAMQNLIGRGHGVEAEMEEVDLCRRLKWIVIENQQ